jgi:hypothetical protein
VSKGLRLWVVLCAWVLSASVLSAQTAGTGSLTGTVTDPSGAVIPNVTVTATDTATGQSRTVATGSDGTYRFALLVPGTYRVRFEASGFKTVEVPSASVVVTETDVLDRSLALGSQTQEVTVQADVETVQTANATVGAVIAAQAVTDLPLTSRNYTNLLSMSAGANAAVGNASAIGKGSQAIATNGASTNQNNYQMDGVSIVNFNSGAAASEQGTEGFIGIPNPDAIEEFKIQTSQYDASYGQNPGANVNVVTKSGTNQFHGTAFEFFRNTVLNANDFFLKRTEFLKAEPNSRGALDQNQFGGAFGGQVKKDKLFFFVSYQETRQKNGVANGNVGGLSTPVLPAIPSVASRGTCPLGDTLAQCEADPNTLAFVQALGALYGGKAGTNGGVAIQSNGSNINPVSLRLLQLQLNNSYYIPSGPGGATAFTVPAIYAEHQGIGNWDYVINNKNTLSGRFFGSVDPQTTAFGNYVNGAGISLPGFPTHLAFTNDEAVLKLTTLISANVVNEVRASYQRNISFDGEPNTFTDTQVGITPLTAQDNVLTSMGIGGALTIGANPFSKTTSLINQYQLADQVSWSHGIQTIRAGFEGQYFQWNWNFPSLEIGNLTFTSFPDFLLSLPGCTPGDVACTPAHPTTTVDASGNAVPNNGSPFSNISNSGVGTTTRPLPNGGLDDHYRARAGSAFVQDDIKISRRLTVNAGIRWEYNGYVTENNGKLTNIWPSLINVVRFPGTTAATGTLAGFVVPSNAPAPPPGVFQDSHNYGSENAPSLHNFAPRVGVAWQPLASNRLVLRGGFGFFYDRINGEDYIHSAIESVPYTVPAGSQAQANYFSDLAVPFTATPAGNFLPRFANFATGTSSNINEQALGEIFRTPVVYQWNLNAQYEFIPSWVLELGYVRSRGVHQFFGANGLTGSLPLNPPALATPTNPVNCGYDGNPAHCITATTASNASIRVPYVGMAPFWNAEATTGDFKYNSLQATVRKQFSHGLQVQGAYTWSRAFAMSYVGNPNLGADPAGPILLQQYGENTVYHPNRFTLNYSWNLPFGRGDGLVSKAIGGWNLAGETTIQDGTPLTITDSRLGNDFGSVVTSTAQFCSGAGRGNVATSGGIFQRVTGSYLNAAAFAAPSGACVSSWPTGGVYGSGTGFGDAGQGLVLGPGQDNWDISLAKLTKVGGLREDATLQFRAEFFNAFNHPQFNNPGVGVTSSSFGKITSASVNPRLIQFALKYAF